MDGLGVCAYGGGGGAEESSTEEEETECAAAARPGLPHPLPALAPRASLPPMLTTPLAGCLVSNKEAVAAHLPFLQPLDGGGEFSDKLAARGSRRKPPTYGPWAYVGLLEEREDSFLYGVGEGGGVEGAEGGESNDGPPPPHHPAPLTASLPPQLLARVPYTVPPPQDRNALYSYSRCAVCGCVKEAACDKCWNEACSRFPLPPLPTATAAPPPILLPAATMLPKWSLKCRSQPQPSLVPTPLPNVFVPDASQLKDSRAAALIGGIAALGVVQSGAAPLTLPVPRAQFSLAAPDAAKALQCDGGGASGCSIGGAVAAGEGAAAPAPASRYAAAERQFSSLAACAEGGGEHTVRSSIAARTLVPLYFNLLASSSARGLLLPQARAAALEGGAADAPPSPPPPPSIPAHPPSPASSSRSPSPLGVLPAGFPSVGRPWVKGAVAAQIAAAGGGKGLPIPPPARCVASRVAWWQWGAAEQSSSSSSGGGSGGAEAADAELYSRASKKRAIFTVQNTLACARNKRDALAAIEELERARLAERQAQREAALHTASDEPSLATTREALREVIAIHPEFSDVDPYLAPAARGLPLPDIMFTSPLTAEGGAFIRHELEAPGAAAGGSMEEEEEEEVVRGAGAIPFSIHSAAAALANAASSVNRGAAAVSTFAQDMSDDLVPPPSPRTRNAAAAATTAAFSGAATATLLSDYAFDASVLYLSRQFHSTPAVWGGGPPPLDPYLHTFAAASAQTELDAAYEEVVDAGAISEVLKQPSLWHTAPPEVDPELLAQVAGCARPGYPIRAVSQLPGDGAPINADAAVFRAASFRKPTGRQSCSGAGSDAAGVARGERGEEEEEGAIFSGKGCNLPEEAAAALLSYATARISAADHMALIKCVAGALVEAQETEEGEGVGEEEKGEEEGEASGEGNQPPAVSIGSSDDAWGPPFLPPPLESVVSAETSPQVEIAEGSGAL